MIFYFSGQFPQVRRDYPGGDKEMDFFQKHDTTYDRLVCLFSEKDADQCFRNVRRLKSYESGQISFDGDIEHPYPRRRS
jgi:hypothetical protein